MQIRRAKERGSGEHGWLTSRHSFSFADYYDPKHMGVRALRVLNEDIVAPGRGFGTHPHRDMEIITYVLEGALRHEDSMGNGSLIRPGDVQRMSAGTGVRHSEHNASEREPVHFIQIWIVPDRAGHPPGYEQKAFDLDAAGDRLVLVASPDGSEGSVRLNQDARLFSGKLRPGGTVTHGFGADRHAYVHVARGSLELDGTKLETGDAATVPLATKLSLTAHDGGAEVLLFDLA
jgi:redox-sensitive bicupin YhaK (pirin superfamily)